MGDPREIEIVGDVEAAEENWHFDGPFKRMTFAARCQHKIYWGGLKSFLEWSLKTWMAPWAYIASVLYHDMYWYPRNARRQMHEVLNSEWGRLFKNYEQLTPTADGWPDVGPGPVRLDRSTAQLIAKAFQILGTCIVEAPEAGALRRRRESRTATPA